MDTIVKHALSFVGQKEIPPNAGFIEKVFHQKMVSVGWYKGAPWCAFFVKMVWRECGLNTKFISGGALDTAKHFSKLYGDLSGVPVEGALAICRVYKNGKPVGTKGHVRLVTKVNNDGEIVNINGVDIYKGTYNSVDGNTSDKNGRDGIMVAERFKLKCDYNKADGLRLVGFINPVK